MTWTNKYRPGQREGDFIGGDERNRATEEMTGTEERTRTEVMNETEAMGNTEDREDKLIGK